MKKLHFRGAIVHKNVQLSKITPIWPLTYTINGGGGIPQNYPLKFEIIFITSRTKLRDRSFHCKVYLHILSIIESTPIQS